MSEYVCEITDDYPNVPWCDDDYSDTVERRERVVRCRDCAMYDDEDGMCMRDPEHTGRGWYARPDGFCAWGRKEGRVTFWDDPHPLVLHRGTFASKETAEAVRRHIRELDKGTLTVIARDIEWDTQLGGCPYFEGLPMEISEELDRKEES